jgi:hypothetical protein
MLGEESITVSSLLSSSRPIFSLSIINRRLDPYMPACCDLPIGEIGVACLRLAPGSGCDDDSQSMGLASHRASEKEGMLRGGAWLCCWGLIFHQEMFIMVCGY